jgi:hypothetical protein
MEMTDDVVDGEIDPLDIRRPGGRSSFLEDSQDLSSPSQFDGYDDLGCSTPHSRTIVIRGRAQANHTRFGADQACRLRPERSLTRSILHHRENEHASGKLLR